MHRFDKHDLSGAPTSHFTHAARARFQDIDAAGIVFYARILVWCHDAWFAFLEHQGVDMPAVLASAPVISPMAHAEADYFRPVRFGDRVAVELVAAHLDGAELALGFRLRRASGEGAGEIIAVAQQAHLFVDRARFARTDAPAELVARLGSLLGG